ncbi:hypothetical protein LEP1GSC125_3882 [Leptospira mayottensis 200901122]|uniref:Uncharacterized protein n=1 Tax=Leptospira mayottensis 200901122 TaxID=1193010 RepID=A0AA87MKX2_9LEPT|nr:hypothetical protein LEP1GSC125_3882 [Leptospira mayottensis 200901122]
MKIRILIFIFFVHSKRFLLQQYKAHKAFHFKTCLKNLSYNDSVNS